jgi:putative hydrolase of the HAD superfamily
VPVRAVIFDLWDTLVEWPATEAEVLFERLVEVVPVGAEEFGRRWRESYRASQTGPLAEVYRAIGVPEEHVEAHVEARREFGRRVLRPRRGAVETLVALRRRGLKLAVLSVCSEEVPAAWPATELAELFDAETFSSDCSLMKPEPEIYLHTARALETDPSECFFVGDGANDELAGAARVGMTPVLFAPGTPRWAEVRDWEGLRVSSMEEVLELFLGEAMLSR